MSEYIDPKEDKLVVETDTDLSKDPIYVKLLEKLEKFKQTIAKSDFFKESLTIIDSEFTSIRCLALGSPQESNNALYQMAYLILLAQEKKIDEVSIYDPIFNQFDLYLMKSLNYKVEMEYVPEDTIKILYFMPHAPLELTDIILNNDKPCYLLANNLVNHTDRFTKLKLYQTYPLIALLVKLVDKHQDDGFVKPKKRRNKLVYQEPVINYDYSDCYFKNLTIDLFKDNYQKNDPWGNSFSDLSYHKVSKQLQD